MTDQEELYELIDAKFPTLYERELKDELSEIGKHRELPAGTSLIDVGQYIKTIPLVISGKIKIFREDEEGNELFLYYLYPGDACAISLVCTITSPCRWYFPRRFPASMHTMKRRTLPFKMRIPWLAPACRAPLTACSNVLTF